MNDGLSEQLKRITVTIDTSNPALLQGLEVWLSLGLISNEQVKRLSQHYLTCPLPEPVRVVKSARNPLTNFTQTAVISEDTIPQNRQQIPTTTSNFLTRIFQGLKQELSVRWLLFLGLFLVIVSSTVLAASQWQRFTNLGQYLILFTYTLIFWVTGVWLNRQENLQLTSQTVQNIAFLLIPINFWALDSFRLWGWQWGWLIIGIACCALTFIFYQYSHSRHSFLIGINFLGLSYLHWGWQFDQIPIIAVYLALIVTTIILRILPSTRILREIQGRGLLVYGLTVLLIRAIFVVNLPLQQLGLAIAVSGWLLQSPSLTETENQENSPSIPPLAKIWEIVGIILLFLGWLVSINQVFPWQATIISLLAIQFFWQRLRRDWLRIDLLAIFLIGLQEIFLIERLIPLFLRQDIIDLWINFSQTKRFTESIYSLILFPYLASFVELSDWLYRQSKPKLARFGEGLSLFLGMVMTSLSLLNLTARSLNLLLGTLLLIYIYSRRQPIRSSPIYLTHILGLLTIFSFIDWQFPDLSQVIWIKILIGLMVVEWAISILQKRRSNLTVKQVWYRSCWHLGFFLASLTYILLWQQVELFLRTQESHTEELWWLLAPLTLTVVASRTKGRRRRQAAFWSSCGLIFAQTLILWIPDYRLFSLGFGAGLMLFNTFYLRRLIAARIQIGFTLALQSLWLGRLITTSFGQFFVSSEGIITDAITLVLLWFLNICLKQRQGYIANLYSKAAENWAIFLCIFNLLSLTIDCLGATVGLFSLTWHSLVATLLIGVILIYRYWQHLNYWVVYGVAWILEILVIQTVVLTAALFAENFAEIAPIIATVNIILAFFTLGLIGWLSARISRLSNLITLQALPLIIAMMGLGWRWGHFTAYTGLLTVGAGITGVMVGYRLNRGKTVSYLAVTGISLGIYEAVIYYIRQTSGSIANNLLILALVTLIIVLIYRFFASFCHLRGYQQYGNLTLKEIRRIAHIHWGIGSIFKFISLLIPLFSMYFKILINPILLIASLILPVYALIQGRYSTPQNTDNTKNIWVYLGLIDLIITAVAARLIWEELKIFDPYQGLIVCSFALIIYYIPWRRWGWNISPWQRIALSLPLLSALKTIANLGEKNYFNVLLIAVFYVFIAIHKKNIRWSYISLVFLDYSLVDWLLTNQYSELIFYAVVIGLSIIYVAQFDQILKEPRQRSNRHFMRMLGSSIICLTALLFYQKIGLTPAIISLLTLLTGLGFQIRAFLLVGTITFIMTVIYQLIVVSFSYSFVKWIIGLIVGILLITIAANFERRREQMVNVWQNWMETLNQWQ